MIRVTADFHYNCDTKAEVEWVVSNLPPNTNPIIDWVTKTVHYQTKQDAEKQ